jgi:prepilin-type N-terminal cleavage/methylation domain-containing protein
MKLNKTSSAHRPAVASREGGFTLIELLVVIAIIAILASIALPAFSLVQLRGKQTKDMSNGKQIALGLKQFAVDHDGVFPNKEPAADYATAPNLLGAGDNSNDGFWWLFPNYLTSEDLFVVAGSSWSPNPPNNVIDAAGAAGRTNTLAAGECAYYYITALNDTSNPQFPLLGDAGAAAGLQTYTNVETNPGGVWKGKKAIVIFVDGSGRVMTCDGGVATPTATFVLRPGQAYNITDNTGATGTGADEWLAPANLVLAPE